MKSKTTLAFVFFATALLFSVNLSSTESASIYLGKNSSQTSTPPASSSHLIGDELLARLPLTFEKNLGQYTGLVDFAAHGPGYDARLNADGLLLVRSESSSFRHAQDFGFQLRGANRKSVAEGIDRASSELNYLVGNDPRKWRTNVPTFRAIRYHQIYPGIDLIYHGAQQALEYDFEISAHASPRSIRLKFSSKLRPPKISATGELVLHSRAGELVHAQPVAYQEIGGERYTVKANFVTLTSGEIGFEIEDYDHELPLIIDPTLIYSTYLGGAGNDLGSSIAIDNSNHAYVVGTTGSANFPTSGPAYPANSGLSDIFVTKIDLTGNVIVYSTYIGGSGLDRGDGIAIDNSGNAYVVGRVDPTSNDFPTTPGSWSPFYRGGDFDGIVFKLNAQGNGLVYSTFLGGEDNDSTEGVTVDAGGIAYVTGGTKSSSFPTTLNAFQQNRAGDTDAYLTKLSADGSRLLYSTYLGGSGTDRGSGVAIDSSGHAYVAGYTASPDFPTIDPFQGSFGGSFDAFIAKVDTNGSGFSSLEFCSYLGGAGDDKAFGIAIDSSASSVYIAGQTSSSNFPLMLPEQPFFAGVFDAFIARISSTGDKLSSTYLGGSGDDRALGIAVNSSNQIYVTGFTSSTDFPTIQPIQSTNKGGFDAFVTKLNSAGTALLYSTYLGGSGNENTVSAVTSTNPIAVDAASNAYVTGYTSSSNFPSAMPTQSTSGGGQDAFIARISDFTQTFDYSLSVSPGSQAVNPGLNTDFMITATPAGGFTGTISLSIDGLSSDAAAAFTPSTIAINDLSPRSATLNIKTTSATPAGTYSLNIHTASGSVQHSTTAQLIVSGSPSADLSLTKTASPNPAIALSNLSYRVLIINKGPSPATNVTVNDTLPPGVSFVSSAPSQGSCSGTATVTCNLGSMAIGAQASVSIIVIPPIPAGGGAGQIANMANVTATEPDPNPGDNSVTLQTTVNQPTSGGPSMADPNLSVKQVVSGLSQPTTMAFIGDNDFLVLEKNTGKVKRVVNGVVQSTVLDLAVNSASERGLLGIALHPNFSLNGYVYLYWTQNSNPLIDSSNLSDVDLMANRLDRFIWNGSSLTLDRNILTLRALQADASQPQRGNNNGGVLQFGPDGKLYVFVGDEGRRGFLQNLSCGPTSVCPGAIVSDDNFGGPTPDDAHLAGVILRLNDDGSIPSDNLFYNATTGLTGQAALNVRKIYAYGIRNGFGMTFDPLSGNLWDEENGDDAFDELNLIAPGTNSGWIQIMGPSSRIDQFKQIETSYGSSDLQQIRWPPSFIADSPSQALARLYYLPGSHYHDPEFSWKYSLAPAALGFVQGRGIGPQFEGDMFVGAARTLLSSGYLFRFKLSNDRSRFSFSDSRLNDLVADNTDKYDLTESESLLIGSNFGVTTDIVTGPNGDLFLVSNSNGAIYEISGKSPALFVANLNGAQSVPPAGQGTGTATILLNADATVRVSLTFSGLALPETAAKINGPAAPGNNGPTLFGLPSGQFSDFPITLTPSQVQDLKNGLLYIQLYDNSASGISIRGQFGSSATTSSIQFNAANLIASEGSDAIVNVTRIGDVSGPATVDYSTSDDSNGKCDVNNGQASSRCDYLAQSGTLHFEANETIKTISIPLIEDSYAESNETFSLKLSNAVNAVIASPSSIVITITDNEAANGPNVIDQANVFVRQHYLDFLNREPDQSGFSFWTNQFTNCVVSGLKLDSIDAASCDELRVSVSAAFFLSIEFQQTAYLVERVYKSAYGDDSGSSTLGGAHQLPVPIVRFSEFLPDAQQLDRGVVVGQAGWETVLESNKQNFLSQFVQRSRFVMAYPTTTTPTAFVDQLNQNAGNVLSTTERAKAIALFAGANDITNIAARAQVVRQVAEDQDLYNSEYNRAFVLMQYFGYLRRNPNDGPDVDYSGFDYWLTKLNQFNGDYSHAEMVKAFITSTEYRRRFGP